MSAPPAGDTAVLLAGGRGTRLAPYTAVFPKPLVPIGQYPVLDILVRQLVAAGVRRLIFSVGHLAELIEAYFLGHPLRQSGDVEFVYVREQQPLGTAGPLRLLGDRLPEDFLVLNGDILTTLSFSGLLEDHRRSGSALTIATHGRKVRLNLGVIVHEGPAVADYIEKPAFDYDVSMGVYAYSARALALIPPEGPFDLPQLVHALMGEGEKVRCFMTDEDCLWHDIGNPDDYAAAQRCFAELPSRYLPDTS